MKYRVTTRLGTSYVVDARDADHARTIVLKRIKDEYPKHVPRATAQRDAASRMSGATTQRETEGIRR